MNARELLIRIRTMFDGKGVEDSTKRVENLGKKTTEVGQSSEQAMNLMGTAAAAASGNFEGVAAGVVRLTGKIKLLGMSMMQLSLVAAVLTLLVKLFQAIAERADAMAASLRQIKSDNVTNAIDQIKKSYDSMTEAAERAAKSRNAMFDVDAQEIESIHKKELAQIEYNKQMELGTAKTDDERKNIEARYKSTADASTQKHDTSQSGKKQSLLLTQADEAETAAQDAFDTYNALKEKANIRVAQNSRTQGIATKEATGQGSWLYTLSLGTINKRADAQKQASEGVGEVASLLKELSELKKTWKDKEGEADILRKQASIVTTESQASTLSYKAVTVADTRAARDRDAEARAAAQRKRLQEELDAAEERKAATVESRSETKQRLAFRASTEAAEAKSAQAAHSPRAAREVAESRAAAQAVAAYAAETTSILKQLEASMKAQRDALKRLPN
jgi:chemotaxis protein histidine kinase CheA